MAMTRTWLQGALPAVLLVAAAGCSDRVTVYPVEGKITYNGKPMQGGGSITFVPLTNQKGKAPAGEIDESGNYKLTTYSPGDGSMAGEFRVVITQTTDKEPEPTEDGKPPPKVTSTVPANMRIPLTYSDHHHSPLKATVEAKDKNEIDFNLEPMAPAQKGARLDAPLDGRIALMEFRTR